MKTTARIIMRVMRQCSPDYDVESQFATVDVEVDVPENMLYTYWSQPQKKHKTSLPAIIGGEWLTETQEASK